MASNGRLCRGAGRPASDPLDLSDLMLRSVPPHNLDAERAVLGGALLRPELLDTLSGELRERDFYSPDHRAVWAAMLALWRKSQPVDVVSLADALTRAGALDDVGGPAYLAELLGATVAAANARAHAKIMRDLAGRRAMLAMGARMLELAYDMERDPAEFAEIAAVAVEQVLGSRTEIGAETPAEFLPGFVGELERLGDQPTGIPSPFEALDRLTEGFQPGEVIVLGGRPSDGKTALALQFMRHWARGGVKTGVFSLEMSQSRILKRIFSADTGIPARLFRNGHFDDEDWSRIYAQAQEMDGWPIYLYAGRARRLSEIRAACRRWRRRGGLDAVVIDYAQLIEADGKSYSREQDVAAISGGLKALAEDLGLRLLLLAQVNRDVDKRKDRLKVSDLRESGAIEQDADMVLLIQPWRSKAVGGDVHEVTLSLAKARDGEVGDVHLVYNQKTVHFEQDFRRHP